MKKMKIFAKFWQNILTHVVNISLKIWKFEGESLQNIEFDQQKHYSFSLLKAEYLIFWQSIDRYLIKTNKKKGLLTSGTGCLGPKIKRRFASWSLQMLLGCCECWMFPHLSCVQWQFVTPGPCATSLHIHQLYTPHFLLQSPRNQTGRPTFSLISTAGKCRRPFPWGDLNYNFSRIWIIGRKILRLFSCMIYWSVSTITLSQLGIHSQSFAIFSNSAWAKGQIQN